MFRILNGQTVGLMITLALTLTSSVVWADPLYSTTVPTSSAVDPADVHGTVSPAGHALVVSHDKEVIEAISGPYLGQRRAMRRQQAIQRMEREHPIQTRLKKAKRWLKEKF